MHSESNCFNKRRTEYGFTLTEVLIVVVLISIIMAIALPNYRKHVLNNAQVQAKQQSLVIADQLKRWRAKHLSYAGFILESNETINHNVNLNIDYSNGRRYVPLDSNGDNYRYLIRLKDASGSHLLSSSSAKGNGWRMIMTPNPDSQMLKYAEHYYIDSLGQRCIFKYGTKLFDITSDSQCIETW